LWSGGETRQRRRAENEFTIDRTQPDVRLCTLSHGSRKGLPAHGRKRYFHEPRDFLALLKSGLMGGERGGNVAIAIGRKVERRRL